MFFFSLVRWYDAKVLNISYCIWYDGTTLRFRIFHLHCIWYDGTTLRFRIFHLYCIWYDGMTLRFRIYHLYCIWYDGTTLRFLICVSFISFGTVARRKNSRVRICCNLTHVILSLYFNEYKAP